MGQIADSIMAGEQCDSCGCVFFNPEENKPLLPDGYPLGPEVNLHEHGYPVTCWDCWKTMSKSKRKDHTRALYPSL